MAIHVVCTGCLKSFQVSDKFAGKSGPCPNCKQTIQVPALTEQIQIHAPEGFGAVGTDTSARPSFKPIARTDAKIQPVMTAIIVAVSLVVLFVTWVGGRIGLFNNFWILTLGLLLISPPLVIAAYAVLYNDELEPYRDKSLYLRSAICAGAYVVLWGVFAFLTTRGVISGDLWVWMFVIPPFLVMGGMIAMSTLDLELGDAMFHYGFYILVTVLLHRAAGMKWAWDLLR